MSDKESRLEASVEAGGQINSGHKAIHWAEMNMALLRDIRARFERDRPFDGITIGMCLHVEPKTAVLCRTLQAGGAQMVVTGSPGTTKDDVADAMRADGIVVYGRRLDGSAEHAQNIQSVLSHRPQFLMDNGADLTRRFLQLYDAAELIGCTEETTTGANLLREELRGEYPVPIVVINDSPLKQVIENEHGVGQTIVEGFMRTTNLIVPTKRFVVIGYGTCGRGIARYLRNLGAQVLVVERDSIAGLEAALDGFRVLPLDDALPLGQVFITVTGRPNILLPAHFEQMRDGAVLANAGHFSWEIDLDGLAAAAGSTTGYATVGPDGAQVDGASASRRQERLTPDIEQFTMADGRQLLLLTRGEMLNLAQSGGGGNPIETMDLGFALQASSVLHIVQNRDKMLTGPQPVPHEVNVEVAANMLRALQG